MKRDKRQRRIRRTAINRIGWERFGRSSFDVERMVQTDVIVEGCLTRSAGEEAFGQKILIERHLVGQAFIGIIKRQHLRRILRIRHGDVIREASLHVEKADLYHVLRRTAGMSNSLGYGIIIHKNVCIAILCGFRATNEISNLGTTAARVVTASLGKKLTGVLAVGGGVDTGGKAEGLERP